MVENNDEYEILPHQLLADLKSEVEALKKKLTQPDSKINELILEIESIKDSIHELNTIFQQAVQETKEEDATKTIKEINNKLNEVLSQNEIIAKGMIAISDKVDDFISKQPLPVQSKISAAPVFSQPSAGSVRHDMGIPLSMGGMSNVSRMAPPPQMEAPAFPSGSDNFGGVEVNFPPPPPSMSSPKKRLGLFK